MPLKDARMETERQELLAQQEHKVSSFAEAEARISALADDASLADAAPLIAAASEPLADLLDARLGASVTDTAVYNAHARQYEAEYMEDMAALNVRMPDALTRVTEYVPQIIEFVQKIMSKGLAYGSGATHTAHHPRRAPSLSAPLSLWCTADSVHRVCSTGTRPTARCTWT